MSMPGDLVAVEDAHQRVRAVRVIEHVFYLVFPPDEHAGHLVAWLRATRREQNSHDGPARAERDGTSIAAPNGGSGG